MAERNTDGADVGGAAEEETQMQDAHKELAMDMFQKITEYLNGELAGEPEIQQ